MKIIDTLRKLGILRGGIVTGSYKNYKDMPDELMYDDVYDKKKDLVGGENPLEDETRNTGKTIPGIVWIFWLFFVISIFLILFLFLLLNFTISFFIILIVWLFFIYKLFVYKAGGVTMASILIYFFFIFCISFIFLFIALGQNGQNSEKITISQEKSTVTKDTDCKELAQTYDKKVFTISSTDNLKGEIGLRIDHNSCEYEITWHTVFSSSNIVKNVPDANSPVTSYDYIADIVFTKDGSHPEDGNIDPIFMNQDKLPTDPFNIRVPYSFYLTKEIFAGTDKTAATQTFHHVMQGKGTFSQSTIDEILGVKQLKIYSRLAGIESTPIAEFNITISEK